jgi:pSer/pThr/pTyr-binding forkhead associated (FHA) protein
VEELKGRLAISRNGRPVRSVALTKGRVSIGRNATNDIVLEAGAVSRRHAAVSLDTDGRCCLEDLGSKNGTIVGGERIANVVLAPGEAFTVGAYRLQYLVGEPPPGEIVELPGERRAGAERRKRASGIQRRSSPSAGA